MIIVDKALWYKRGKFDYILYLRYNVLYIRKNIYTALDSKQVDNESLLSTDEALDRLQYIRISLPG